MHYNGKELDEMTIEEWDGKPRRMLAWNDDEKTWSALICGYNPLRKSWICAETSISFSHCAEIPTEEKEDVTIDELKAQIKRLREDNKNWCNLFNEKSIEYEKLLEENKLLKEENKELKEKINPEKKYRRMTYKELDEWLEQGKGVVRIANRVSNTISYDCESRNQEVSGYYKICGYDEDTWHYPMIEV